MKKNGSLPSIFQRPANNILTDNSTDFQGDLSMFKYSQQRHNIQKNFNYNSNNSVQTNNSVSFFKHQQQKQVKNTSYIDSSYMYQDQNSTIMNSSIVSKRNKLLEMFSERKNYERNVQDLNESIHYINQQESKDQEDDIQNLKEVLEDLNNQKKKLKKSYNIYDHHHIKIQQNSLYQIDLYKDEIKYLKFELQDQWPIKIKVESISGEKFDLYFSFSEHFPTDKMTGNDNYIYINKAEHLYQFFKPKFLEEQYLFIGLKSKEQIKVNTKIWVSDFKMDQKRAEMYKKYVKTRAPVTKKYVSFRKSKLTKFDQEQQQQQDEENLKREVENILKKRKKKNKSLYQVNILERNRQIADNLQIYQQKKNIDILMHGMKCEQNYQKKIFLEQQNIQNTIEKIEERRFLQQYKIYLRNKEIKRAKLNVFSKQWLVLLEITKVIQKMDERMKLEKLVDIFRNYRDRVQRAFRIQFLRYKDKRWGTRNLQLSTFMEARNHLAFYAQVNQENAELKAGNTIIKQLKQVILKSQIAKLVNKPLIYITYIKQLQRFAKNRKRKLRESVMILINYSIQELQDKREDENLGLYRYLDKLEQGDKIEIMLRYIAIQKQKMGRLYKIKKGQIEGTQNDMVFYYEALTQNQVNEQKIEENQILEIIDPVEIQIKKYLKLKNAELLFRQKYKKQERYGLHQNLRENPEQQDDIYYSSDFQIEQEWFLDYYQEIYKINKKGYQIEKMRKSIQSKNLGIQKSQENKQEEGFFLTQDKQLQNQNNVQNQQQQQLNKVNDIEEKRNEEDEAKQMRLWYIVKKQKVKDLSLYIIEDRILLQEFLIDVLKRKEKQEMEMEEIQQAISEKQQEIQKSQEEKAQNELKVFLQK